MRIAAAARAIVLCGTFVLTASPAGAAEQTGVLQNELPPQGGQDTYYPGVATSETRTGHGEFALTYQYAYFNGATISGGVTFPIGRIDSHALFISGEYWLTNRLAVLAGIPYIVARYEGPFPHNLKLVDPNAGILDNGNYHGNFQDIILRGRYLALDEDFKIEPFLQLTIPSWKYPTFSHSSIGQRLFKVEVGGTVSYYPPFDDWYVELSGSRVFVEHILGHSVDHWKASFEPGYYVTPEFAVHADLLVKQGNGLSLPQDFPGQDELFFEHDRLIKMNYIEAGGGFDWILPGGRRISLLALRMIQDEDSHILKFGAQLTLGQSF